MSLVTNLQSLATRIATEFKVVYGRIGTLGSLNTTDKTNLVAAINEVNLKPTSTGGAAINDAATSTTTVWSSTKTDSEIGTRVNAVVNAAPGTLDTLDELAAALGDDPNFATTTATALGNRVRYDAAQTLTAPQQTQARSNIGAGTSNLVLGTTNTTAKAGDYAPPADAVATTASMRTLGTGATQAAAGNDSRLSDARTPTAHTHTATDISNSTAVGRSVLTAVDAAAARTAIGAGTSNLVIGTTTGTAPDAALVGDTTTNFVTTFEAGLV